MSKADESWSEVGKHFTRLGKKFKEHYGTQEGASEATSDIKDAFQGLVKATERVATTIGDTVRDSDVQEEAKQAANSFVDAIGVTFGEVGAEFKRVFTTTPENDVDEAAVEEIEVAAGEVDFDEEAAVDEPEPPDEPPTS